MASRRGEQRLPRGRHRLGPAQVAADQRRRLRAAGAEAFAARGFGLTSRQIASAAQVSSGALYRHFAGADEVLAAAFEEWARRLALALGGERERSEALIALGAFLESEPGAAALLGPGAAVGVEAIGAGRGVLVEGLGAALLGAGGARAALVGGAALALLAGGRGRRGELVVQLAGLLGRV